MNLKDRVVIVTGGGSGIGRIYSLALAKRGVKVAIADINAISAEKTVNEITSSQGTAISIKVDVSDEESTRLMAKTVYEKFGKINGLVNNAAIYADLGRKKTLEEITTDEFEKVMAVNVLGVWNCTKAVLNFMKKNGGGSIVNISSTVALVGTVGFPHYVASKSAVIGLTRSLARELGKDGIRVNAIAPGLVTNEATLKLNEEQYVSGAASTRALKREQTPEDLVGPVLFFLSEDSGFVSGQTIVVDGGSYMN